MKEITPITSQSKAVKWVENADKIILHLCASKYGSDTLDYVAAGYDVRLITEEVDVRTYHPPKNVYGIIANPPCTMFSIARSSHAKIPRDLEVGMELVKECLRVIWECQYDLEDRKLRPPLKFWALENPATGMLRYFLGKPAFEYSPDQFGAAHTKRTALWGIFNEPIRPLMRNTLLKGQDMSSIVNPMNARNRRERTDLRSIASPFFTKAFFLANQ